MMMLARLITRLRKAARVRFGKKKPVLVYVGMHEGAGFNEIFRGYDTCYGFEADPEWFAKLKRRFGKYPRVHVFNFAVSDTDGEVDFNISSNAGLSSSVGVFKKEWGPFKSGKVRMTKTIRVASINLHTFLRAHGIDYIDTYISDIQGLDLTVLTTLKPMIEARRIGEITCEVTKDEHRNIYDGVPDNSESGFDRLLRDNYDCVAKGWGNLEDDDLRGVPEEWWEMDCKWRARR